MAMLPTPNVLDCCDFFFFFGTFCGEEEEDCKDRKDDGLVVV